MSHFLISAYKGTTFTDSELTAVNTYEVANGTKNRLLASGYLDDPILNASPVSTPTPMIIVTGYINIKTKGTYVINISGVSTGTYIDVLVGRDRLVFAPSTTELTVNLSFGFILFKVRAIQNYVSTPLSFNIQFKFPGSTSFTNLPIENKPIFGNCIFPFDLYNQIDDSANLSYKIIGDDHQNRDKFITTLPYKKFLASLHQKNVYERLDVKDFFYNIQGKKGTFWLPNKVASYNVVTPILANTSFFYIKPSFDISVLSFLTKYLYIEEINFITRILNIESALINSEVVYKVTVANMFTSILPTCTRIQLLSLCRLDTDSLNFDLIDLNLSDVKLQFLELPNDYR
jgi:hypothetical protein